MTATTPVSVPSAKRTRWKGYMGSVSTYDRKYPRLPRAAPGAPEAPAAVRAAARAATRASTSGDDSVGRGGKGDRTPPPAPPPFSMASPAAATAAAPSGDGRSGSGVARAAIGPARRPAKTTGAAPGVITAPPDRVDPQKASRATRLSATSTRADDAPAAAPPAIDAGGGRRLPIMRWKGRGPDAGRRAPRGG